MLTDIIIIFKYILVNIYPEIISHSKLNGLYFSIYNTYTYTSPQITQKQSHRILSNHLYK